MTPHQLAATAMKPAVIHALKNAASILAGKQATAGFDGFTDTIARIIRKKQTGKPVAYFSNIKQFGAYITDKQHASFSLEVEEKSIKPGGNMPIMSHAMGTLGTPVHCIGAFGYPNPYPVFDAMSRHCSLHSFANPGASTAFEFNDGKMFLASMGALNATGWDTIKHILGIDHLRNIFRSSNLVCLLNWSEIDASSDIWKGLLGDVMSNIGSDKERFIFADLSDCSKRGTGAIKDALQLLAQFGGYGNLVLSLNKNESGILGKLLSGKKITDDPIIQGSKIFDALPLHTLLIHTAKQTTAYRQNEQVSMPTFYSPKPAISTGAGDHFNAGFCVAQLLQLDLASALWFANATAGVYIRTGVSPTCSDLITFLEKQ